jgi:hypothetical protein
LLVASCNAMAIQGKHRGGCCAVASFDFGFDLLGSLL